ncbi:MAG TPA: ATP phosphoribosyltransferase regulatory subunit, partial [Sphingomonadales bacterium]
MADRSADYSERALLPEGFHDDLPPDAEYEASIGERLLARFYAFGYERVSPPLVEFEESLLAGSGRALSRQMFRLMDPASQRMMGIRTDMTIQVARIAGTRLAAAARPLR